MSLFKNPVVRHYFRLDARSLGLFRVAFGLVLFGDLFARWRYIDDFYSNEGVLPNHNHLFNLKEEGKNIWSVLHAFSTTWKSDSYVPGDTTFAFLLIAFFYGCFTLGWKTRSFHLLSFLALVSLTTRNLLAENIGSYLGIAVLGLTWFLPLGSRVSIDGLKRTVALGEEATGRDLNLRSSATLDHVEAARAPGWSPVSFAAFAVLAQLVVVYASLAMRQTGAWRDGSAIGKALHIWTAASPLGFALRDSGLTTAFTYLVTAAQWAVPVLLLVPVARGPVRLVAAALMAAHGLILGLLFNFGLFGWTLAASSFLVISSDFWDKSATRHDPARVRTVIYDSDCGMCFWLCRLLKRLDTRKHLIFQPNDTIDEGLWQAPEKGSAEPYRVSDVPMPKIVTRELVESTICVVTPKGEVTTRAAGAAEVFRALPMFGLIGRLISLPLVRQLADLLYRPIARYRTRISAEVGLPACGVPVPGEPSPYRDLLVDEVAPARQFKFKLTGGFREIGALFALVTMLGVNTHANDLPIKTPKPALFDSVAWYSRTLGDWSLLVPEPPTEQSYLVSDAMTRGVDVPTKDSPNKIDPKLIDVFTGQKPTTARDVPFRLGSQWASYLARIQDDKYRAYQQAFRTYVGKGGPRWDTEKPEDKIVGIDVYWLTTPTMAGSEVAPTARRLFRVSRGGAILTELGNAPVAPPSPAPIRPLGLTP